MYDADGILCITIAFLGEALADTGLGIQAFLRRQAN